MWAGKELKHFHFIMGLFSNRPYFLTTWIYSVLIFFSVSVQGAWTDELSTDELRLRLDDNVQMQRTTSLNWVDLDENAVQTRNAVRTGRSQLAPFRIMLDAGHGGRDLGALGHFGTEEKKICLAIAELTKREIEKRAEKSGFKVDVRLTRSTDQFLTLSDRVKSANDWQADAYVSIHGNSSPVLYARGFEVYFQSVESSDSHAARVARKENQISDSKVSNQVMSILSDAKESLHAEGSSRLAELMYLALSRSLRANGRGVRQAPFAVLHGTDMPSILIEVGYLTNPEEAKWFLKRSYLKKLSNAISSGILDYALSRRRLG